MLVPFRGAPTWRPDNNRNICHRVLLLKRKHISPEFRHIESNNSFSARTIQVARTWAITPKALLGRHFNVKTLWQTFLLLYGMLLLPLFTLFSESNTNSKADKPEALITRSNWNLEQGREPTTNSTHMWHRVRESNPGHSGGRRALPPLRHPCIRHVGAPRKGTNMASPHKAL